MEREKKKAATATSDSKASLTPSEEKRKGREVGGTTYALEEKFCKAVGKSLASSGGLQGPSPS